MIKQLFLIIGLGGLLGCSPSLRPVGFTSQQYVMQADSLGADATMLELIAPFRAELESQVLEVVGVSAEQLQKGLPESALGNLLADLALKAGRMEFGAGDLAMLNYGGIRAALPADTIRRGHVMEMLPFANMLQLVRMDGMLLQTFLDHWAAKGGTPMAGVRFGIVDGKAVEVLINGKPLVTSDMYAVIMPDYVANGGDGCGFLSEAISHQLGSQLLLEVAMIGLKEIYLQEGIIQAKKDGRIYKR
ncbi:MAG: 5'-nucleotidase [Sphingobacteriaceae bacterium]|nr:5'-nucleotidase [Sphingobacteriaceae bacterium]